jgi:hypothetical protein
METRESSGAAADAAVQNAAVIRQFLHAVESGTMEGLRVLSDEVVLDATVPGWRFSVRGAEAVRAELGRWYAEPGSFEELGRIPIPGGELVTFTLCWEENGVPHAVHQAHLVSLREGRIERDQAWCGGRWPAALLAEMAEAARD